MIESKTCGNKEGGGEFVAGKAYRWLAAVSGALVVADQITKTAATLLIKPYETISTPLGGLLRFTLIRNDGAAFGIMSGRRWIIVAIAAAMALAAILMWRSIWRMGRAVRTSAAVVLAGSVGNMIDRIRIGEVIDFIEVPLVPLFQVFNFADAYIVLGSLAFIYALFRSS